MPMALRNIRGTPMDDASFWSTRGVEVLDWVRAGESVEANLALVEDLCDTMKFGSLCALGGFTPYPVMSALTHFPEDFRRGALPLAAE